MDMDATSEKEFSQIVGAGGGGGGKDGGNQQSRTPVEAANNLFSVAFAKTVLALSEGEIEGFPSGSAAKDIFLDGTAIQRSDDTFNFNNVTIDFRVGTDDQSHLSGFSLVENTVGVGVEVTRAVGPVIRNITNNPSLERARIIIQHPSLQSVDTSTGDTNPTSVSYQISLSTNGGPFVVQATPVISGKSSGQFQRAYEFDLPGNGPWQVKVERLTADSTSSFLSNSIIWQATTEIIDEKLAYPNTAVLGVKVDARQFNNIPNVTVKLRGKKIEVPTNYDPTTRTYTGIWDGTFKTAYTDNPAWIFRDLVVNPVYGIKRYLPSADCDPWYLYTVSQYCDELVPDGFGGTEPRFTCNVYLQNEGSVFEAINSFASIFRGLVYYNEGKLFVTQDRPSLPAQQFSEANVIQEVDDNGLVTSPCFSYSGSSRTARRSVVLVNWDDPLQDFSSAVEYLQDDELLRQFGYLPIDLRLIGVTSRGQALRAAKATLFANRNLTEKVTFRVAAEGLAAGVGEVIQVSDPNKQGQRVAGRIRAVSGNTIALDSTLSLSELISYTTTIVAPNGETVTNPDGSVSTKPLLRSYQVDSWSTDSEGYTTLTLSGASVVDSIAGSLWVLEWQDLTPSLYRILAVNEYEPLRYEIEAIQYNDSLYGFVDNNQLAVTPKDRYTIRDVNPPTNLTAKLDYRNGRVRIFADWVAPQVDGIDDVQVNEYRYEYRLANSEQWTGTSETPYTDADVSLPQYSFGDQYQFRVAARNRLGQQSNWLQVNVQDFDPISDLSDPAYNTSIRHQNQPDGTQLLLIDAGSISISERIRGYVVWAKPLNPDGPVPGVKSPNPDGFYTLSDDTPLAGYYAMAFHTPSDYLIRVAFTSNVPGEVPSDYLYDTVYRDEIVPPAPVNFTVVESQDSRTKRFSWQIPRSTYGSWDNFIVSDITGYAIRYRQGELNGVSKQDAWRYGVELYSGGVPATQTWFDTALFDTDVWTVMVRSTDATGWQSDDIATIALNTNDPLVQNVVETGSLVLNAPENEFDNCELTGLYDLITQSGDYISSQAGDLIAAQGGATYLRQIDATRDAYFTWRFDNNNIQSTLTLSTTASATYQHFLSALAGSLIELLQEGGNEILLENGDPMYAEQRDYTGLQVSQLAPGVLHPYAPLERLTEDLYGVRTVLRSIDGSTQAELTSVDYQLDYPDLFEYVNDAITSPSGTTISFTKIFRSVKAVQVTVQDNGQGGITARTSNKDNNSVDVVVLNAAGNGVTGLVDVLVQGY